MVRGLFWHHGPPWLDGVAVLEKATTTGRYHRQGEAGAWYASSTEAAMWKEFDRHYEGGPVDRQYVLRRAGSFEIEVEALDLTDEHVLKAFDIEAADLVSDDFALPQLVAGAARSAGFRALLVPSAAIEGATSLVVFADGLDGVHEADVGIRSPQ